MVGEDEEEAGDKEEEGEEADGTKDTVDMEAMGDMEEKEDGTSVNYRFSHVNQERRLTWDWQHSIWFVKLLFIV